jgi:hypothetical protein
MKCDPSFWLCKFGEILMVIGHWENACNLMVNKNFLHKEKTSSHVDIYEWFEREWLTNIGALLFPLGV